MSDVVRERTLTPMQREQLEFIEMTGRAHGNSNTAGSLVGRGFVTWDRIAGRLVLTDKGRQKLHQKAPKT